MGMVMEVIGHPYKGGGAQFPWGTIPPGGIQ